MFLLCRREWDSIVKLSGTNSSVWLLLNTFNQSTPWVHTFFYAHSGNQTPDPSALSSRLHKHNTDMYSAKALAFWQGFTLCKGEVRTCSATEEPLWWWIDDRVEKKRSQSWFKVKRGGLACLCRLDPRAHLETAPRFPACPSFLTFPAASVLISTTFFSLPTLQTRAPSS